EFDPDTPDDALDALLRRRSIPMQASGQEAFGSFVLQLEPDRTTPTPQTYQVTFDTQGRDPVPDPASHTTHVARDLPPVLEILTPKEQQIEVAENGQAVVEVRALDADFGLSRVGLKLTAAGKDLADAALRESAQGHTGQSVTKFTFKPSAFNLKAGAEVAYWGTAADNRTAPLTAVSEPNTERTQTYF